MVVTLRGQRIKHSDANCFNNMLGKLQTHIFSDALGKTF